MFALLFLAFAACASAGTELDLTDSDFDQTIKDNEFVLVMFYAPWCGHCKNLKPKFTEAAGKTDKFVLAKVDCTAEDGKATCERFGVKGYPTLKFFKNGQENDYNGPRDTDGILAWLEKKSGPAAVTLADADALKAFVEKKPALVGFFDGENAGQKAFFAAADDSKLEEFLAGQVLDKSLFGDNSDGDVIFYPAKGEPKKFEAGTDGAALATTLFESTFPLVQEVGGHNFQKYVTLGKPLYLLFMSPSDPAKDDLIGALETAAAKNTDEAFSWIDAVKYKAQIKGMGCKGDNKYCVLRMSSFTSSNKPITLEKDELTAEAITEWVEGIHSGKYKYVPKSEDVPAEPTVNGVTTLVGKTFDDVVFNSGKNAFVEFYAPWCGHCKSLAPKWDKLGEEFASNDDIIIAKVDATANDIVNAGQEVKGFPTLLFYKAGSKTPIQYSGARETEDLSKWVKKQIGASDDADEKDEL